MRCVDVYELTLLAQKVTPKTDGRWVRLLRARREFGLQRAIRFPPICLLPWRRLFPPTGVAPLVNKRHVDLPRGVRFVWVAVHLIEVDTSVNTVVMFVLLLFPLWWGWVNLMVTNNLYGVRIPMMGGLVVAAMPGPAAMAVAIAGGIGDCVGVL